VPFLRLPLVLFVGDVGVVAVDANGVDDGYVQ